MGSDFNFRFTAFASEGELKYIDESDRYKYYITRIHGVLHFVKAPSDAYADDLVTLEALRKEFLLGYGLNHPSIVRYLKFEDNKLYEEFIDGYTLRQLIDNDDERLQKSTFIVGLAQQLFSALGYLHRNEILHLDIKPENIMITDLGNVVKLIDLSCAANGAMDTTPGFTKEYMAPEQAEGKFDASSDIYAVGKIIDELTTGKPFRKKWRNFIEKATANQPDKRFRSSQEAEKFLEKLNRNPQNLWAKYGLVLALTLIIGIVAWIFSVNINRFEETQAVENNVVAPAEGESTNNVGSDTVKTNHDFETKHDIEKNHEIVEKVTPKPEPAVKSEIDIERRLTNIIYKRFDEIYSVEVIPLYELMLQSKENRSKYEGEFVNAYIKGFNQMLEYGDELAKEYPNQKDFINEKIVKTFETRVGIMNEKVFSKTFSGSQDISIDKSD